MPRFLYSAYGLSIASEIPLPELEEQAPHESASAGASEAESDVTIRLGSPIDEGGLRPEGDIQFEHGAIRLGWPRVGVLQVRAGREVTIEPFIGVSTEMLRLHVLGPCIALALHQRGFVVLHASAVALPQADGSRGVAAFLGDSGEGKSTLAAALHARGHALVADDFIAVPAHALHEPQARVAQSPTATRASQLPHEASDSDLLVAPGYGQLRLWPPSLDALGEEEQAWPLLLPDGERRLRKARSLARGPLPLRRIYVLGGGENVRIDPAPAALSVFTLLSHCFCRAMVSRPDVARLFQDCGVLARRIPPQRLCRPRDLRVLDQVARAVEQDFLGATARG